MRNLLGRQQRRRDRLLIQMAAVRPRHPRELPQSVDLAVLQGREHTQMPNM